MSNKLKAVAVVSDPAIVETLTHCLRHLPKVSLSLASVNDDLSVYGDVDLVLFELSDSGDHALSLLTGLYEGLRQAALVVISPHDDALLIRRLMRLGARDVIKSPIAETELTATISHLVSEKHNRQGKTVGKEGRVAAFFSAKGSSGATFLATNTACSIAYRHEADVALIDLDIQFGNTSLLLDLKPENSVLDALRESDRLDSVFLGALMAEHPSGLGLLASPGNLSSVKDIQASAVRRLLATARQRHDITIIDLPRLVSAWTLEVLTQADHVFIVMQNNLSALRDTGMLLEFLPRQGIPNERIEVINNRAMSNSASATIEQLKQTLRRDRIRRIRNDYLAATMAEDKGQAIIKSAPQSKLAIDINNLADYLCADNLAKADEKDSRSWLKRLIKREAN